MTGNLDLDSHALRNASELEFSVDLAFTPATADILELVDKANSAWKSLRLAYLDAKLGINVHSHKVINVLDPTVNQDAATKKYVDDNISVFSCSDLNACSIANLGTRDHHLLIGLGDDDHTQYYNAARHTKAIHDSLGLDHGSLSGKGDDDHTQYLIIDGTRAMTGDLDLDSHALRNASELEFSVDLAFTPLSVDVLELVDKANTAYKSLKLAGLDAYLGINVHNHKIFNVLTPTSDYDAATKKYVDDNVGVTDHGALTGLADDDHTQYLLINGTRAMTGNLNINGNQITNVGQIISFNGNTLTFNDSGGYGYIRFVSTAPKEVKVYYDLLPYSTLDVMLGSSTKKWNALYANYGHFYGTLNVHSQKITNVLTPTADYDAATKKYVDDNAGATDHGALTGLGDYDHDQYLRKNGAQAMTGNLDMGSSYIRATTTLTLRYQTSYRLALGSTSIICYEDFIPTSDNGFTLGLGALRWSDLYATVVHEGDVAFSEKECIKCNKKFKVGDNIVYKVIRFDKETEEPMAIPIHLECANSPPKKVKKKYAVEEDYYVWNEEKGEVVKGKRNKMVTKKVKKRKIKEGNFEFNDKTGEFWKLKNGEEEGIMVREQKVSIDEATKEIEEESKEVVYKEEEFTI